MTAIRGAAAAVTGAASGIGRALALELAARGCDLALADRDEAGLQAVAAEIAKTHSRKVTVHRVDVAEASEIEAFAPAASGRPPRPNIVRNSRTGVGVTDNERRAGAIERFDSVAKTTPAAAALRIIKGIENNEPRILIGNDARMMDLLQRFLPGTYWAVLSRWLQPPKPG